MTVLLLSFISQCNIAFLPSCTRMRFSFFVFPRLFPFFLFSLLSSQTALFFRDGVRGAGPFEVVVFLSLSFPFSFFRPHEVDLPLFGDSSF